METITGTVVKVTDEHIVLLTNDGRFKNISRQAGEVPLIGQPFTHIEKKEKQRRKIPIFRFASIAAALFIILVTSFIFPFTEEHEEVYIISLDINPSIEIATDRDLHVMRAEGLNDEGIKIVESLHWEESLYTVIDEIIEKTVEAGYIEKHVEPIVVTSVIPLQEASDDLVVDLKDVIDSSLNKNQAVVPVSVTLDEVEVYDEAKQSNLSVNYYKEYKQLEKQGIVQSEKEIKGKTISELKRMEKQPKKERAEEESQSSNRGSKKIEERQQEKENKKKEPPVKKEPQQKQNQGKENRGNQPGNQGKPPADRGKSNQTPANQGKEKKENNRPQTPPGQQKREDRPSPPGQQQNKNSNQPNPPHQRGG
ncbi:anti-sigma factor domain-containing protein [Alkalihalobacterium alkalinitrilicum]|uniref:anti-sigma-I factor RsgI family protein n=1 Tax=Alkalihalobacterium alkalinitrilicum TaxID=427920 RepID=UPI0013038A15|nr:anti-sigma factor domain-containing protein [Alkalihalobacterium alkalinitrilicum]